MKRTLDRLDDFPKVQDNAGPINVSLCIDIPKGYVIVKRRHDSPPMSAPADSFLWTICGCSSSLERTPEWARRMKPEYTYVVSIDWYNRHKTIKSLRKTCQSIYLSLNK